MTTIDNITTTTLANGVVMTAPKIAVGSYCTIIFTSDSTHAGEKRTITISDNSVAIALDGNGSAKVSLMPFMRIDMAKREIQDMPITNLCRWRGSLDINISSPDATTTELTTSVYYIFGECAPDGFTDEVHVIYNAGVTFNMAQVDWANHYVDGVPTNLGRFMGSWYNLNEVPNVTADKTVTFQVQQVCGNKIYSGDVTYRLHYISGSECGDAERVAVVRWVDHNAAIGVASFIVSGESLSRAESGQYHRWHPYRNITDNYYFGDDMWGNVTSVRSISMGSDSLPSELYDFLSGLGTSSCVEVLRGDVWVRANIGEFTLERGNRKSQLTVAMTLHLPTMGGIEA